MGHGNPHGHFNPHMSEAAYDELNSKEIYLARKTHFLIWRGLLLIYATHMYSADKYRYLHHVLFKGFDIR